MSPWIVSSDVREIFFSLQQSEGKQIKRKNKENTRNEKKKRVNEKKRHFRKIHETEKEMMENNNER